MPGEVPSGWTAGTLAQIAEESRDRFLPGQDSDASMPYVGLEHIEPGVSQVRLFGSADEVSSQKTAFLAGDVLFGKLRPYLKKVAQVDRAGVCSTDILALRPRQGTDAGFLLTLLSHDETIQFATGTSAGTKMPRTSWSSLSEYPLLLPPLPEQKKIAAILSSVDEAIQATQAVIDQTRRVKEGLLQDLLTRGLPGHTRFKQTEIGEIPESWEVRRLNELAAIAHGFAFKSENFTDERTNYHLLSPGNFSIYGGYQEHKNRFHDGEVDPAFVLSQGDLLVTMTDLTPECQTLGLPMRIPVFDGYRALHNQRLGRVRIHAPDVLNLDFLECFLLSRRYRNRIKETASGSTVRHTSPSRILESIVALPPLHEQRRIADTIKDVDQHRSRATATVHQLHLTKTGLLQDLLTGTVRVAA